MTVRQTKENLLKNKISHSLLLPQSEKEFWLNKIETLPDINLERLLSEFQEKNKVIDRYIQTALQNDPNHQHLSEMKALIINLKKEAFQLEGKSEEQDADALLEKNLSNLS